MTTSAPDTGVPIEPFSGLEVATVSGDALRASVRVSGCLEASTVALLSSVLRTHTTAGRRYLRVDLATAMIADDVVVAALVESHRCIERLGGMLIFENAGPQVAEAIRATSLYVQGRAH